MTDPNDRVLPGVVQYRLRVESETRSVIQWATTIAKCLPEPDPAEVKSSVGAKAADYAAGDVIDGRFEVLEVLGQGGFSKVYRVRDEVECETGLEAVRQRSRLRSRTPRDWRPSKVVIPTSCRCSGLM